MVEFNDRRQSDMRGIQQAVSDHLEKGQDRRVSLSFNNGNDGPVARPRYSQSGYLRTNESGDPALYPNSRSTKGRDIPLADLYSIGSSRKDSSFYDEDGKRAGKVQSIYWQRLSGPYRVP